MTTCWNAGDTYDGEHQNIDDRVFKEDQIERSIEFTRNTGQAKEDGSTDSLFDRFPSDLQVHVKPYHQRLLLQRKEFCTI